MNSSNTIIGENLITEVEQDIDTIMEDLQGYGIEYEDIDFSRAIRVYNDFDIFEDDIQSVEQLRQTIENAPYVYYLPIDLEDVSYYPTISKVKRLEGRWGVPQIGVVHAGEQFHSDYLQNLIVLLEAGKIENKDVYFVGGLSSNSIVTAVLIEKESSEINDESVLFALLPKINPDNINEKDLDEILLPYSSMKEIVMEERENQVPGAAAGPDVRPEGGIQYKPILMIVIAACVLAFIIVITIKRLRRRYYYKKSLESDE